MLTEREAWLRLADHVAGRTLQYFGLCELLRHMRCKLLIDGYTYASMIDAVDELPAYALSAYKWPPTEAGDLARAAWCREQAAKCEEMT